MKSKIIIILLILSVVNSCITMFAQDGKSLYSDKAPIKINGTYYEQDEFMNSVAREIEKDLDLRRLTGQYAVDYRQEIFNLAESVINGEAILVNGAFYSVGDNFGTTSSEFSKGYRFDKGSSKKATAEERANDLKLDAARFLYRGLLSNRFTSYSDKPAYSFNLTERLLNDPTWKDLDSKAIITRLKKEVSDEIDRLNTTSYRRKFNYYGSTEADIEHGWDTRHQAWVDKLTAFRNALEDGVISMEEQNDVKAILPNYGIEKPFVDKAIELMEKEEWYDASQTLTEILKIYKNGFCFLLRGYCYRYLGYYKSAIADYTDALLYCKDEGVKENIHYNRGLCKLGIEDIEGAIADFQKGGQKGLIVLRENNLLDENPDEINKKETVEKHKKQPLTKSSDNSQQSIERTKKEPLTK